MEPYLIWVVAGIALITFEMMIGTVVLLVLGLAAFAGALVAWLGHSFALQTIVAVALAATGMVVASTLKKKKAAGGATAEPSLDIGHTVILDRWINETGGVARVRYRDATWDARVSGERTPGGTVFYIVSMDGSTLNIASKKS